LEEGLEEAHRVDTSKGKEISRVETRGKENESPPPPPPEMLSPIRREREVLWESGSIPFATPPLAMSTPEQSRQFQPPRASPSYFLSPDGMSDSVVFGDIHARKLNFESVMRNGFDAAGNGMDTLDGSDVMVVDG
jgi:hypothetical protein